MRSPLLEEEGKVENWKTFTQGGPGNLFTFNVEMSQPLMYLSNKKVYLE